MLVQIISWIATIASLSGQILINNKNKLAFYVWITSNILWIVVNVLSVFNIANVIMYIAYTAMNINGLYKWNKEDKNINENANIV